MNLEAIEIKELHQYPEHYSIVAQWIHAEFWLDKPSVSPQNLEDRLRQASSKVSFPASFLALVDGQPVGTINLIENDDETLPNLKPWLAALYVLREHRNKGIAKALIIRLLQQCRGLDFKEVFLGTDNPSFYEGQGASRLFEKKPGFFIMKFDV